MTFWNNKYKKLKLFWSHLCFILCLNLARVAWSKLEKEYKNALKQT